MPSPEPWRPTGPQWEAFLLESITLQIVGKATSEEDRARRTRWVEQFAAIHAAVPCAHQEPEWLIVADLITQCKVPGPVVELGAYQGGSTAKLSHVCADLGRPLIVCDSFQGLPTPEPWDTTHGTRFGRTKTYHAGDYAGKLEDVQRVVETFGRPDVVTYVPGWYAETLPTLDVYPAVVVEDADLAASVRTAFQYLWPKLLTGGYWLTHEAATPKVLAFAWDSTWWHLTLGQCPPQLRGAGTGLGPEARNLGWTVKC